MNEKDIINFRNSLQNYTIEELEKEYNNVQDNISKMILDSELVMKAAIINALLEEKKEKKGTN